VPILTFHLYKSSVSGEYLNDNGGKIAINSEDEYTIFQEDKAISHGKIEFITNDARGFYLDNDANLESTAYEGKITDLERTEVYTKK
jgi:hypothetical protein